MNLTGYADYSILPETKKGRNAMKEIQNMMDYQTTANNTNKLIEENFMNTNKEYDLNEIIFDGMNELDKATFMLDDFIDIYEWNVKPTPEKAIKYGNTINASEKRTFDEELSYKLYSEYDKMMMMIRIARDYCYNAIELLKQKEE